MSIGLCSKIFSETRMSKYLKASESNEAYAEELYRSNILLSEALYPSLSVLEVALRNAISNSLAHKYEKENWYEEMLSDNTFNTLHHYITDAISRCKKKKGVGEYNASDVVASFSLGFWVILFNKEYEQSLWKTLRLIFKMPKNERQRKNISAPLNKIRVLRNRIFHHEPIIFTQESVKNTYHEIQKLLTWLDPKLLAWLKEIDGFEDTCEVIKANLSNCSPK